MNPARWPDLKSRLRALFRTRSRDEWCAVLEGTDAGATPMLDFEEAPRHSHNVARKASINLDGMTRPAPAPRFSRTLPDVSRRPPKAGEHHAEALADWGVSAAGIRARAASGAL